MHIKCSDLPGVGKKTSFVTAEGDMVVLVTHHTGKREMYFFEDDDGDEVLHSISFGDDEAKEIGAQLIGVTYQPIHDDSVKILKKKLIMEWIELKEDSPLVGMTLEQSDIRAKTGASVMAIMRGDNTEEMIVNPAPSEILKTGDTVMAAGNAEQIKSFATFCKRKGD